MRGEKHFKPSEVSGANQAAHPSGKKHVAIFWSLPGCGLGYEPWRGPFILLLAA